ncbi:MAG: SDR family NAD(P)-dependent oxidoreductase, partial [Tumebacillaceae bacterium]
MALLENELLASYKPLKDRVALVTGGSRGIGAEIAKELAAQGATVVINYVSNELRAQEVVKEISAYNPNVTAMQGNVSDLKEMQR